MDSNIKDFIKSNWDKCIKINREDNGTLIGLPYPYVVPAIGHFDEMYYWDTYFTNIGLILSDKSAQAKNNVDNMLYLTKKYGFMPNGNRTYYLNRSQPPFLSEMVKDIYDCFKDDEWLGIAYATLKIEYEFWMTKRNTPIGLNRYGGTFGKEDATAAAKEFSYRIGYTPNEDENNLARHFYVCAESGWDMNPRWGTDGYDFAPVDLNSLMYLFEKNMEYFSNILKNSEDAMWNERAKLRRERMILYMQDENGLFMDYNFKTEKKSKVLSAASIYPLFARLADETHLRALIDNLYRLEGEFGIFTCEKNDVKGSYQWDYPNGWACLQYIAFKGFDNYGCGDIAERTALKYKTATENIYRRTGNLWEKYNAKDGSINVTDEYKMPTMMGWSAGVYLAAEDYLNN